MSAAILTLMVIAFVGGLGLLAQMARKSRGAEVTLIVVVLALSVVIAALGTLTVFQRLWSALRRIGVASAST